MVTSNANSLARFQTVFVEAVDATTNGRPRTRTTAAVSYDTVRRSADSRFFAILLDLTEFCTS